MNPLLQLPGASVLVLLGLVWSAVLLFAAVAIGSGVLGDWIRNRRRRPTVNRDVALARARAMKLAAGGTITGTLNGSADQFRAALTRAQVDDLNAQYMDSANRIITSIEQDKP